MTWTDDYEIGAPVRVRHQGGWRRAQVVTIRNRSLMVLMLRGSNQHTTNIHDPRNIEPWPTPKPETSSTLSDPLLFD